MAKFKSLKERQAEREAARIAAYETGDPSIIFETEARLQNPMSKELQGSVNKNVSSSSTNYFTTMEERYAPKLITGEPIVSSGGKHSDYSKATLSDIIKENYIPTYDENGTLTRLDLTSKGNEALLNYKVKKGTATDEEARDSRIYQNWRKRKMGELGDLGAFANEYSSWAGYHAASDYDGMVSRGDALRTELEKYIKYSEMYDPENVQRYIDAYNEIGGAMNSLKEQKSVMSQFKDEEEYKGYEYVSGIDSYKELNQLKGDLRRRKGTGSTEQDAEIDKQLKWLDDYGFTNKVISTMTDDDWEYEGKVAQRAKEDYERIYNLYDSPAYLDGIYKQKKAEGFSDAQIENFVSQQKTKSESGYNSAKTFISDIANYKKTRDAIKTEEIVTSKKDFHSKSGADKSFLNRIDGKSRGVTAFEQVYYGVNNGGEVARGGHGLPVAMQSTQNTTYSFMTEKQRKVFNYLYNTEGEDAALIYLDNIQNELNQKYMQRKQLQSYQFGQEHPYLSIGFNTLEAAAEGIISPIENVANAVKGVSGEIDPYELDNVSHFTHNARISGGVENFDSKAGKVIYSGANAIGEMLGIMLTSKGMGSAFGTGAAAKKATSVINSIMNSSRAMQETTLNYKESGESDSDAVIMGMIDGTIEYLTEKWSMDNILKSPDILRKASTAKKLVSYGLKFGRDFATEGSEEVASSMLKSLAAFITDNRENDDFLSAIDTAKANGASNGEAFVSAVKQVAPQYLEEFIVGGIAGGAFGTVNTVSTVKYFNNITDDAAKYFNDVGTGKLAISSLLIENGVEDEADIVHYTDAIYNMAQGKKVSAELESEIKGNDTLRGILYGYVEAQEAQNEVPAVETKAKVKDVVSETKETVQAENKVTDSNVNDKVDDINGNVDNINDSVIKSGETVSKAKENVIGESERISRKKAWDILLNSDENYTTYNEGRAGRHIYLSEATEGEGGFIDTLINEGYSAEDASKIVNKVYNFMYEQGAKGRNMQNAIDAVSENIISGFDKTAELFYSAGKIDAQNVLKGKRTAKLKSNKILIDMYKNKEISYKTARAIHGLASKLGIDIEFVDSIEGGNDASFNPKTGELKISRESKKPFFTAAIHESVHSIRTIDSKSYNRLADVVYEVLSDNENAYSKAWAERYGLYKENATDKDGNLNKDYIDEELTSEVIAQLLTDESYINELAKTNRNLVQKIFDVLIDFFDKITGRYTSDEKNMPDEMKQAVAEVQKDFEHIKKLYQTALDSTESKQGKEMVLPKSIEKQNYILYNKKWHTDLTKTQIKEVVNQLRQVGNPEATKITDTANWYKGRINGEDLFVIYSTEHINNPTILYEIKGKNANLERDILMDLLEVYENAESVNGKSGYVSWVSKRGWMQNVNSSQNNLGNLGRGQNNRNVGVLQKQPQRNGSPAFWSVVENLFEIQYEKSGGDVRHSKADIDKRGNTEQFRVMWTLEENVMSRGEVSAFYDKVSEMKNQKWHNYKVSKDGEYIFEIENKLVYFDGDFDYPEITKVISINSNNNDIINQGRGWIYDGDEFGWSISETIEIAEVSLGERIIEESNFEDSRAFEREISRGTGKNGTGSNSRSGKDVMYSKSDLAEDEVKANIPTPTKRQSASERSAASFELKKEVQAKLDKHIEKYGELEKGVNPVRDVTLPKQTSDDRYVRRATRTAIESERITNEVASQLVEEVANGEFWTTYERVGNKKTQEEAHARLEHIGFDKMLSEWDAAIESGKRLEKQDLVNAELLLEEASKKGDVKTAVRIMSDIAAEGTRAGQVVQSMILIKKLGTAANVYKIERTVENLQKDLDKKLGKKSPKLEVPQELMEEYAETFDREEKAGNNDHSGSDKIADKIYEAVSKQVPATWGDKFNTWRYFAMLGNPRTHIRNMVGNLVFQPAIFAKNMVAAATEGTTAAAMKLFGREMQRSKTVKGVLQGTFKQGAYKYALEDTKKIESILRGDAKYGETNAIMQKVDVYKTLKFLNPLVNANSKALEAEDWFFLKRHYARALTMYMDAHKLSGDSITDKQLELARKYAIREAQKATFRDESAMASTLSLMAKRNRALGIGVEAIMPFKKTPINILKRGIEYSPIGFATTIGKGIADVKNGKFTAAQFIDNLSKNLTGSAILGLGIYLASQAILRGPGDDEEDNKFSQLLGMQNYSLKIGDGTYTIDWMSPAAMALFVGCEIWNSIDDGKITFADIANALPKITEPLFDMSMLDGFANIVETASFAQSSPEALASILFSIPTNYAGQFVPTLLGQVARTADPIRRKTYIDKNSRVPQWVQSFAQQQAKKIPGVTKYIEPYVNAKGEDELNAEGNIFARAMQNFFSPGYYKKIRSSTVDEEIQRLYDVQGENAKDIIPKNMNKYITVDGERINLNAEQYTRYQRTAGQTYYRELKEIISSDYYKSLSDDDRIRLLAKVRDYSEEAGRKAAIPSYEFQNEKDKIFMDADGGYRFILTETKEGVDAGSYITNSTGYEKTVSDVVGSIVGFADFNDDSEINSYYKAKLYEYAREIGIENNSDGKYHTEKSWVNTAKNFSGKELSEYLYGKGLESKYGSDSEAKEAIYADENISGKIKLYAISDSYGEKYTAYAEKYNVDAVAFGKYCDFYNTAKSDDNMTKKEKVINYINSLKIDSKQKSALYRVYYQDTTKAGKSNIKEVPWSYSYDRTHTNAYQSRVGTFVANASTYNNDAAKGQCVWFARGRAQEKLGKYIPALGNANQMYGNAKESARLDATADNLQADILVCYRVGTSAAGQTAGHVIYIEAVDGNAVYYTEGGYGSNNGVLKATTKENIMKGLNGHGGRIGTGVLGFVDVTKY